MPGNAGSIAPDVIAESNERLSAIFTAAHQPDSPEGRARHAALEQWNRNQADQAGASDEEVEDDTDDEDEYEEDGDDDGDDDGHRGDEYERNILSLLLSAVADGLSLDRTAESLGISRRAVAAASERLEKRGLVVFTRASSIIWLTERRLS